LLSARVSLWVLWRPAPGLLLRPWGDRPLSEATVNWVPSNEPTRTQQEELSSLRGRKRQGSNPNLQNLPNGHRRVPIRDFRPSPSSHPRWPSRHNSPSPLRYRARARRVTAEQEAAIRALAGTNSLRSLAADFGVSHESIRAILCQNRKLERLCTVAVPYRAQRTRGTMARLQAPLL
jgi:hypothetical protein